LPRYSAGKEQELTPFFQILFPALAGLGLVYALAAMACVRVVGSSPPKGPMPGISVLKPLNGAEPALADNLRTIFVQDYHGPVQLIFGSRDSGDPALATLAEVAREFPDADVTVVVDATRHGSNNKMSNVLNMAAHLRHPLVVISDSDVAAPPTTLAAMATALADPAIGIVSCLHAGRGEGGFWSRLAAMDISYRFIPSVMLSHRTGLAHPVLGPMMAVRADTLADIGGLERFADELADDFELGRSVRERGLKVAITGPVIVHGCSERGPLAVFRHELRWSLTIFTIDRPGFAGSLITHVLPLAVAAAAVLGFSWPGVALIAAAWLARIGIKGRIDRIAGFSAGPAWWLPLRDILSLAIFFTTFFANRVDWRGARFTVTTDGKLIPTRRP